MKTPSHKGEKTEFDIHAKVDSFRRLLSAFEINQEVQKSYKFSDSCLSLVFCNKIKNLLHLSFQRASSGRPNNVSASAFIVDNVALRISKLNQPVASPLHPFKYFLFIKRLFHKRD